MRTNSTSWKLTALLVTVFLSTIIHQPSTAFAQSTAFTYQGRLDDGGVPANGSYVFRFSLGFENGVPIATPVEIGPMDVTNGLFTATVDFGAGIFTGVARNLTIEVRTNNNAVPYVQLSPTQPILPTPYAIYAGTADAAGIIGVLPTGSLSGSYGNALNLSNPNNTYAGNGGGLTNVNAASLGGLAAGNFWQTAGNAGTTAGVNFLGTTDNQPLDLKVNGQRALRVQPGSSAPNLIGGYAANTAGPDSVSGVTIAGGGQVSGINQVDSSWGTVGGGYANFIVNDSIGGVIGGGVNNLIGLNAGGAVISGGSGNFASASNSVVGGGKDNWILAGASNSVISGGQNNIVASHHVVLVGGKYNSVEADSDYASIGGGWHNTIQADAVLGTIGGGDTNTIQSHAWYCTIAGGVANTIQAGAQRATIGGGTDNTIQPGADYATIAGGELNTIQTTTPSASIGGGRGNVIGTNAQFATISGGWNNGIGLNAIYAAVGGGFYNKIGAGAYEATVGGGIYNSIQTNAQGATIGGGQANTIQNNAQNATIGGGSVNTIQSNAVCSTIGGGQLNIIGAFSGSAIIAGGTLNTIETFANSATIGGGRDNTIQGIPPGFNSCSGTIAGGRGNMIQSNVYNATIGGGGDNTIQTDAVGPTIGGGEFNTIQTKASDATIGGGEFNTIQTNASFATIPGGARATARSYGQQAYASGSFGYPFFEPGSAQASLYVLRGVTTNATTREIFLDGTETASKRMLLPLGAAWSFDILVVALKNDTLQMGGFQIKGMIIRNGLGTAIVGTPSVDTFNGSTLSWAADVYASSADGTLRIAVTGAASTTIRWVASVRTTEVVF